MNLAADALRLAVMETLQPGGNAGGPFPTLAGPYVYDSDFGPMEQTAIDGRQPVIAVYTDDDMIGDEATQDALDPRHAKREVMLALELIVPAVAEGGGFGIGPLDHEIKLTLGILGAQIETALARSRETGPLRHVLVSVSEITTRGWQDADSDTRLAAKRIEMLCRIRTSDLMPGTGAGLDRLPSPLRKVAMEIDPATPRGQMLEALAGLLAAPDPRAALLELSMAATLAGTNATPLTAETSAAPPINPIATGAAVHGRIGAP
jgi:hypothetical protein